MTRVNVVLRDFNMPLYGDITIGVDRGAWICNQKDIPMEFAVGDFDSVSNKELDVISKSTKLVQLPKEKDMTDFEYTLTLLNDATHIYVYGALGGRKDHEYLNLLLTQDDTRIEIVDDEHSIRTLNKGKHVIKNEYAYVSFFPIEESVITLEGFKYPLVQRNVYPQDRYLTSNEIASESGTVHVHEGKLLFMGIKSES